MIDSTFASEKLKFISLIARSAVYKFICLRGDKLKLSHIRIG